MIMTCKIYRLIIRLFSILLLFVTCNVNAASYDISDVEHHMKYRCVYISSSSWKYPSSMPAWGYAFTVNVSCVNEATARAFLKFYSTHVRIAFGITTQGIYNPRSDSCQLYPDYSLPYPFKYYNWRWFNDFPLLIPSGYNNSFYVDGVYCVCPGSVYRSKDLPDRFIAGAVHYRFNYNGNYYGADTVDLMAYYDASGGLAEYFSHFYCAQCKADLASVKTRIISEASTILTLYNNSYQGFTKLLPCNSSICLSDYSSYFSAIANSVPILGLFASTMIVFRRKRQPRKTQGR